MPTEVRATLRSYLDGKIEQFWMRELGVDNLLTFGLYPIIPLAPLVMLIGH
ncbi:hypothetical protein AWB68_04459 [Caballeronia choica]|jgi:hypothetical protein|uniref:Uncharacterized protein n=1 Tax=Caballeronia choica TaxID=326476 RepID=A0A158JXG3_9BURK|nr:hypothetical protein [Caballeronia choica]SAL73654.1 hypothetical protein AWB68_04459 [Caballeronia choica]